MANLASSRASLRSFFVLDFVMDGILPGLPTIVLKPILRNSLSIGRAHV